MFSNIIYTAIAALSVGSAIASLGKESTSPVQVLETVRDSTHLQNSKLQHLRSDLAAARVQQRGVSEVYKTNGSLDLSWNDAELFS